MTRRLLTCWRAVLLLGGVRVARGVDCYYPNGDLSPNNDFPCSTKQGAACCPDKWQCMDNGLCYYPDAKYWGRYGCTDKNWDSPYCPTNICTYNMTLKGDEAMGDCGNGQWCCDGNRQDVQCCSRKQRPFFQIPDGNPYATIGSGSTPSDAPVVNTITGFADANDVAKGGQTSAPAASSAPPKSSAAPSSQGGSSSQTPKPSSQTPTPTPVTSLQTSVSSGAGGPITVILTSIIPSTAAPTSASANEGPSQKSSSKTGVIVGCAVGVPVGLAALGLLFFLFRRHQRKKKYPYGDHPGPSPSPGFADSSAFVGGAKFGTGKLQKPGATHYKHETDVPELTSQSVGPERPISTIKGRAELDSGAGFVPGAVPHAPHLVGVGGGNGNGHTPQSSWGSAPPGYSPGTPQMQQGWGHNRTDSSGSATIPPIPSGATGGVAQDSGQMTDGGRYIPYRPTQQPPHPQRHLSDIAELSAVQTPPAR